MLLDLYTFFAESPQLPYRVIGSDYLTAEYLCPLDVENIKFWNEMHLITYVVSGRKDWFADGEKFELKGGDAAFIRKGVYSTKQYFEVDHCIITFMLNDDFIKSFLQEYSNIQLPSPSNNEIQSIYPIDVNEEIKSIIYSVSNYLRQGREIPKELVEIKFKELLFSLILNPNNSELAEFFCNVQKTDRGGIEYIMKKHFNSDLSLDDFARLCGRSLSTFKREFQECFGQSPGKWLMDKRLEFAKTLLLTTNLNINDVCYDSGFKNTSHFNKAFKERYELPPLQFKQSNVPA